MERPLTDPADRIVASWTANADAWTHAVREGAIASREGGTDTAIVEAVVRGLPPFGRVLDIGCGEGWLCRALASVGATVHGVDASAALVERARAAGPGTYEVATYAEIEDAPDRLGPPVDAVVFNFSLLSDDVTGLLRTVASRLDGAGRVLIQTIHPATVALPSQEGWREESFQSIAGDFEPMPWYFRPFGAWVRTLRAAGLDVTDVVEPTPPGAEGPLSLLLLAEPMP